MATAKFSTLLNRIQMMAPSCPAPTAISYLRDAAMEVCTDTLAWKYIHPNIALTKGKRDYNFAPPKDTSVITIESALMNGRRLPKITTDALNTYYPQWINNNLDDQGSPQHIAMFQMGKFVVNPSPDKAYTLSLTVALKPSVDASGMDADVVDGLRDAIIYNAMHRLAIIPDKAWSDKANSVHYGMLALSEIGKYRARANLEGTDGTITVKPDASYL